MTVRLAVTLTVCACAFSVGYIAIAQGTPPPKPPVTTPVSTPVSAPAPAPPALSDALLAAHWHAQYLYAQAQSTRCGMLLSAVQQIADQQATGELLKGAQAAAAELRRDCGDKGGVLVGVDTGAPRCDPAPPKPKGGTQ